jgi:hypothetical protein
MKVEKIGELSVISSKRGHRSEIVCLVIDAMNEVKFWLTLVVFSLRIKQLCFTIMN